jgi:hypothetical protein
MLSRRKPILLALYFLLTLVAATTIVAQNSASFDLNWHVMGSGGGESSSSNYQINGTIGQHLASPAIAGSATFTLTSGYWFRGAGLTPSPAYLIYLPAVLKD